jgi:hypothetical protein
MSDFSWAISLRVDQFMVDGGHRVLPDQHFLGHLGAHVAGARAHVAVGQLEPGLGEGEFELLRVLEEALGDLPIARIELQRQVGGEHDRRMPLRRIVGVRDRVGRLAVSGNPLDRAGGARVCTHSKPNRLSRYSVVQATG